MGHLWMQQILHEIFFDLSLFKHNKRLPPQREISCWEWCACSYCTPVCMISSCSSVDRNVMALNCFAGDPSEMAYVVPQVQLAQSFFSCFQFLPHWLFFPPSFPTPLLLFVFSLFLTFFILDYFSFFFLCPSLFNFPLSHLLSTSPFAEAQLKQYWHKEFQESETEKDPLEDIY